ncbi:MAG: hypothetical protein AAB642_02880 [Patescibacteria group bacterium]
MKRVAAEKNPEVVAVPEVVGVAMVGVEPEVIVVVINIEHVRIAVRVGYI